MKLLLKAACDLVSVNHSWPTWFDYKAGFLDEGKGVDVTCVVCRKFLSIHSLNVFVSILGSYGFEEWTIRWVKSG